MSIPLIPYIDIHTHKYVQSSDICSIQSFSLVEQITDNGKGMLSVGIHPWNILEANITSEIKQLEQKSSSERVVAIGEVGLDRAIKTPLTVQKDIFLKQISIAEEIGKPLIIHCVKSYSDLIEIRKKHNRELPWIIHGFRKNKIIADELIELGCYLSFGKALLSNEKLQTLFCTLPIEKVFLETDDNTISIKDLYKSAAEVKNIAVEQIKEELFKNFKTCFNKL